MRLFDTALPLSSQHRDQPVLKYAIAFLDDSSLVIDRDSWPLAQAYLVSCLRVEPGAAPKVLPLLKAYQGAGYTLDLTAIDDVLHELLVEHGRFDHGSEMASALWGLMEFGLAVRPTAVATVAKADDPFVALLALDARARGLIPANEPFSRWSEWMNPQALWEPQWPVAYEALLKGWLPSSTGVDYLRTVDWFRDLRAAGVTFYDPQRRMRPARAAPQFAGKNAAGAYG